MCSDFYLQGGRLIAGAHFLAIPTSAISCGQGSAPSIPKSGFPDRDPDPDAFFFRSGRDRDCEMQSRKFRTNVYNTIVFLTNMA